MALALVSPASCAYCSLPLGGRPPALFRGDAERESILFCCQGCAWVFQIFGGRGEGSEAVLVGARLVAAFATGMVVMVGSWSRYLDALVGQTPPAIFPSLAPPSTASDLEGFFAQIYEPLAAGAVFALLGWPILSNAAAGLRRGALGLDALVVLGVLAATLGSVPATFGGQGATYYDTATMILLFVTAGRYVESTARARAARGLRGLLAAPARAEVLRGNVWLTVAADEVGLDDVVRVRPGGAFPVDGLVVQGTGTVSEAALTGESRPVLKEPGDEVVAGATSYDGAFRVQPTRVGAETFLRQLDALVAHARASRAPVERQADRLASLLTVAAGLVGAGTLAYWGIVRGDQSAGLLHGLAVLLIACPCALGIATPLALRVGLAEAARRGILVREAAALETLGHVRALFADKTGTLTTGRPGLRRVVVRPGAGLTEQAALRLAAALGQGSEHPLSRAIVEAAADLDAAPRVEGFRSWPGLGVSGDLADGGGAVALGSERLMERLGLLESAAGERVDSGDSSVVYLGVTGRVVAELHLADTPRPEALEAARSLRRLGVRLVVLSGDRRSAATALGSELGIEEVHAGLQPADKARLVAEVARQAGTTAMLGDGVNDAPSLAAADVGLAMGNGTDLARSVAPVVLMADDLRQVAWLLALARRVGRTVRLNLFWATLYNVVGIGLAAAGLLQPVFAAAAMVASSLLVLTNSLRLQRREDARP